MSRQFDFRHDRDEAFGCIFHYLADVFLRIPASVRLAVARAVIAAGLFPPCSHFRKPRIFLYLYPPALVFGKMPVEHVLLVHCHHVEEPVYFLHRMEPSSAVELHAAP